MSDIESVTAQLESVTAQRFLRPFVHRLNAKALKKEGDWRAQATRRREGHPTASRHSLGSIDFYVIWHGEQKWTIKTDQWTIRSNMLRFEVSGDDAACNRDLTMLMIIGNDEEPDED